MARWHSASQGASAGYTLMMEEEGMPAEAVTVLDLRYGRVRSCRVEQACMYISYATAARGCVDFARSWMRDMPLAGALGNDFFAVSWSAPVARCSR